MTINFNSLINKLHISIFEYNWVNGNVNILKQIVLIYVHEFDKHFTIKNWI